MKNTAYNKILFFLLLALSASTLISAPWALLAGILLGIVIGNPYPDFSGIYSKRFLQYSIIGLGFGLNATNALNVSKDGFGLTITGITITFALGMLLKRVFKIEKDTALLISSGTAICGGSAIAAIASVINAPNNKISISIGVVFILNAIALFVFPAIGHLMNLTQYQFGLWSAIAIHDTSSVVGAAQVYGEEALQVATTVKLSRALWIIALSFIVAAFYKKQTRIKFPWFIIGFIITMLIASFFPKGAALYSTLQSVSKQLLIVSLFLIGTTINLNQIKQSGKQALLYGTIIWVFIAAISLYIIHHYF